MTQTSPIQMLGVAIPTLRELRGAILSMGDADSAVKALREAGYAGGDAVHAAFEEWLSDASRESGSPAADTGDLPLSEFSQHAARFFHDAGWGDVSFVDDEAEGVAVVEIGNCWEAGGDGTHSTGCQITTGLLASFFGKIAGYPVAVLEAECSSDGASQCRFLLGNEEVMNYRWQEIR